LIKVHVPILLSPLKAESWLLDIAGLVEEQSITNHHRQS
jgi:hypothetical protein